MAKKMKTNQEGGAILAKDPKAAAMELKKNQKTEGAAKGMDHKKGGAKYVKGAAKPKPDANGDGIPDYAQDGIGASRMGYNQSFGAARVSGYSKGAAKVADIMSFGASKYMKHGAADKGKPKKNTSGIFGGDSVLGDENNDGNMVTRGLKKLDKLVGDPTMPQSNDRPIIKDGKVNFDSSRMSSVGTGLNKN